ncbi:hypothetical protein KJA15_01255 [Patescibacteria group bacterium]|nr:hypothetical protein [Patescibacteria group bacterium]
MSASVTSKKSETSETREEEQVRQVRKAFEKMLASFMFEVKKKDKVDDIRKMIKTFIEAGILQERAERAQISFDIRKGIASVSLLSYEKYFTKLWKDTLEKMSKWFEATIKREAKALGFNFNWREVDGFFLDIRTSDEKEDHEYARATLYRPEAFKEAQKIMHYTHTKLNELGFSAQIIKVVTPGKVYTIDALKYIVRNITAVAYLRTGVEIRSL